MFIKVIKSAFWKFIGDDCNGKASALSFYTLMSIVPVLAVAFGIAKGFGFEENLEKQILETFYQQKELALKLITFAKTTLEQAKGSLIAGIGALFLFWTSFGLLATLERSLNAIWNKQGGRTISKRIIDFLPILIFLPFYFVASSSLTYLIVTKVVEFSVETGIYSALKPFIHLLYYGLLTLLAWTLLAFLYFYIPERFPPLMATLLASLGAAVTFQAAQWTYIHFQVFLTSYNAIYGSFAAIPLFLLWLQASWLIVLAGAEFAYSLSNTHSIFGKPRQLVYEEELLLALCFLAEERAVAKNPLTSKKSIAEALEISYETAQRLLDLALKNTLLIEGINKGETVAFYPAHTFTPPPLDTIHRIIKEEGSLPAGETPWLQKARVFFKSN